MDNCKINILEFIERIDGCTDVDEIILLLNDYFKDVLFDRVISRENEYVYLRKIIGYVRNSSLYSNDEKNLFMITIERILIFSRDNDRYDRFIKLSRSKVWDLSLYDIYEYIDIMIRDCYYGYIVSKLDIYIRRYLELNGNVDKLYGLIDENKYNYKKNDVKYMNDFIYNNYINVLLGKILYMMGNDNINSLDLYQYFYKLYGICFDRISSNNLILFRDVINLFNKKCTLDKLDNYLMLDSLVEIISLLSEKLMYDGGKDTKIKNDIILGRIVFTNNFVNGNISGIRVNNGGVKIIDDELILTIDDPDSPDLDGAFSVAKNSDGYIFKVYVSNVPVLLRDNRKLCEEVYMRGTSMYVRNYNGGNYNIDMLPKFLSCKYFSLNQKGLKDAIEFTFEFGLDGKFYSCCVDRKRIRINKNISPDNAKRMVNSSGMDGSLIGDSLKIYRELCKLVSSNSSDKYLSRLNCNRISDLVAFPSVLVNYYIGYMADFVIYRDNGVYTTSVSDDECKYTHSVTPIRRFVSNINLAFFLEQNGVVHFANKDLYYVIDNSLEIVRHLNEREKISKFVDKHSSFVRKYIK